MDVIASREERSVRVFTFNTFTYLHQLNRASGRVEELGELPEKSRRNRMIP